MLSSRNPENPDKSLPRLRFLTLNCGFLPHHVEYYNQEMLAPNLPRAEALAARIREKDYDFVCLQEVWDTRVAARLEELLKDKYPFVSRGVRDETLTYPNVFLYRRLLGKDEEIYSGESLAEQLKVHINRGGLMLLSKLPVIDKISASYDNYMTGEESMVQKGYTAYKLGVGDRHFISLCFTHMHAGGAIWGDASRWWGGTTPHRRGEQHKAIHEAFIRSDWYRTAPAGSALEYLDSFFMGDVNLTVDCERQYLTVSGGKSAVNGFDEGDIKYEGMFRHLSEYEPRLPANFQEVREEFAKERGVKKQVLPELVEKAMREYKLTGTDLNLGEEVSIKMIDTLLMKKHPGKANGEFVSNIVEFSDIRLGLLSDHRGIEAEYDANLPRIPCESKYEDYDVVPSIKIDPSAGWWERTFWPRRVNKLVPHAADNEEQRSESESSVRLIS